MKPSLRITVTYAADDALPFDPGLFAASFERIHGAMLAGNFSTGTFDLICQESTLDGLEGTHVVVQFEVTPIEAEPDGR